MTDVRSRDIDIVIVNWNSKELLRRCLGSLSALDMELALISRVIVVDNASDDSSMERLPDCGGRLKTELNSANVGFAAACNQGAALGESECILFLNPDTEVNVGVLGRALKAFEECGEDAPSAVGVQLVTAEGVVARSCARFPSAARMMADSAGIDRLLPSVFPPHFMVEWDHMSNRRVDQVIGAFFLVRRADFDAMQGFDERFFVYYEEVDYCRRWADRGRRCLYLADVTMLHHERGSSSQIVDIALFYSLRSRLLYARKHFGPLGTAGVFAAALTIEPLARMTLALCRRRITDARATLHAYRYLWCWLCTGEPRKGLQPQAA